MGLLHGINEPSQGLCQKMDADLKAYYHHDTKIPNSVISFMKLITEDWQQQQQKRYKAELYNI